MAWHNAWNATENITKNMLDLCKREDLYKITNIVFSSSYNVFATTLKGNV